MRGRRRPPQRQHKAILRPVANHMQIFIDSFFFEIQSTKGSRFVFDANKNGSKGSQLTTIIIVLSPPPAPPPNSDFISDDKDKTNKPQLENIKSVGVNLGSGRCAAPGAARPRDRCLEGCRPCCTAGAVERRCSHHQPFSICIGAGERSRSG